MRIEAWRVFWSKIDKTPLVKPIEWECRHCGYPGVVARRCDVPGFCPYCGEKRTHAETDETDRQVESERMAEDREKLRVWWQTFPARAS